MATCLTKEFFEGEIERTKAAISAHEEGAAVHKLILEKFEEVLKTLPKKKTEEKKKPIGVG